MALYFPPHHRRFPPIHGRPNSASTRRRTKNDKPSPRNTKNDRTSPRNTKNANKGPSTWEAEYKHILNVATQSKDHLNEFRRSYRLQSVDFGQLKVAADDVMKCSDERLVSDEESLTAAEFILLLEENSVDENTEGDARNLRTFANKVARFEYLIPRLKINVKQTIRAHLSKYCVSLIRDCGGLEIECVEDYEKHITRYGKQLEKKFELVESSCGEFNNVKSSFLGKVLEDGKKVNKTMDEAVEAMLDVVNIMKRWVNQDRNYPAKLSDQFDDYVKMKKKLRKSDRDLKKKREGLAQNQDKLASTRSRTRKQLQSERREGRKIQASLETVDFQIERNEQALNDKKSQEKEVQKKIEQRKSDSSKKTDKLAGELDQIQGDVEKLEDRSRTYQEHKKRLSKHEEENTKQIKSLEGEMAEYKYEIKELGDEMAETDKELDKLETESELNERKIRTCRRIREMKVNQDTLKLIHHQRLERQHTDELQNASRLVARKIGRSWPTLYQSLPFSPRRSRKRREHDVELVYTICLRRDKTFSQQAFESLQKWRVLNRQKKPGVGQLVQALRHIERNNLATALEKEYDKAMSV